jgi:hypothetical protein
VSYPQKNKGIEVPAGLLEEFMVIANEYGVPLAGK